VSQNGSEPRAAHAGLAENNVQQDGRAGSGKGNRPVRVPARLCGPSGRRYLAALIVDGRPWCGGTHLHRGTGGGRRAGCGLGEYIVMPTPHLGIARRPA
jgi:hypothetical protein